MSDEPRRSGRATKGVGKPSSSPAPSNIQKPTKNSKSKGKKSKAAEEAASNDDEEDVIRCICKNDDPDDPRAFIGCDACSVWQHNVCMGEPVDDEDVPDHYFCEECRPEEHSETIAALERGEKIWEERERKFKQWKKMSSSRKKSKGGEAKPTWLKAEIANEAGGEGAAAGEQEAGSKRKRGSVKQEPAGAALTDEDQAPSNGRRPDKRRKSAQPITKLDPDTAVVELSELPKDRKRVAENLAKVIIDDGTAKAIGERQATLIEYALYQNYGAPTTENYKSQFRAILANLKKNKVLIERLLEDSLTADELATMDSKDMASEEQQLERKKMKEELDRQAVAVQEEGPMYRQSHKGIERVEYERIAESEFASSAQPVRERNSVAEGEGSPLAGAGSPNQQTASVLRRPSAAPSGLDRRTSSQQQFDMNNIWQKTGAAQSPTMGAPRPMQMPPRRRSSVHLLQQQDGGAKEDADVDRMLQDDDYEPQAFTDEGDIVWRGRLHHAGEGEPLVNARFVAGRDLADTAPWRDLLPEKLSVDGRLAIDKAEEYLCGLQYSQTSDLAVLALSPYDNTEAFNNVFQYFKSRDRYAVVNKNKPPMAKDLYIIPVEKGAESLPAHMGMLEHCSIKPPVEDRVLLASMVVARHPLIPQADGAGSASATPREPQSTNGQQHLPTHMRGGGAGPSGSPLATNNPTFSPSQQQQQPTAGYGAPAPTGAFPPNPYSAQAPQQALQALPPHPNPMVVEVLGPRQWDATAQQVLAADPNMAREKLEHLRKILDEDVAARTDIQALAAKLMVLPREGQ